MVEGELNRGGLGGGSLLGRKPWLLDALFGAFLVLNLVVRFATIFNYPPYNGVLAAFFACIVGACGFVVFRPKFLKALLFLFGFSFFLFGFASIDIQGRVFELIVTCVAATLFVMNWRARERQALNRPLLTLLGCYVGLSLFSLLLLPVRQIVKDLWLFGFPEAFFYLFIGQPYGFFYPAALVVQLMLFVVLGTQLSSAVSWQQDYKALFFGAFSGAVFSSFIGLLDFYGVISLAWYRFGQLTTPGVLHSTFQNRNCFGEYVLAVIPFVMIGFLSRGRGVSWKLSLFGSLVICEIALILSGGRAGWVTYPLILFICWVFFYFSREGRLESFHLKWRDLVKVAVSVPLTIGISFLLIFYVLMPLSDAFREKAKLKGIAGDSKANSAFLANQAERITNLDIAGRDVTWRQGIDVGREKPVFGMGYESFPYHAKLLVDVAGAYFNRYAGGQIHDSPHNVLISIWVSGGIVGLGLWLLINGYALAILAFDLVKRKTLLHIPVIVSIISFHSIGMVQSMQHIPMIWLLIFLSLGYALAVDAGVLPGRVRSGMSLVTKVSVLAVVFGFLAYVWNFESRALAAKYGMRIYSADQEQDRFTGFFQPLHRWKYGEYRWCGKRGAIYVPGGGLIELDFHCRTPGLDKEPVVLTVSHGERVLDSVTFAETGTVRRTYELPEAPGGEEKLLLEISRTWNPHNSIGNFDRRELGVGVAVVAGLQ